MCKVGRRCSQMALYRTRKTLLEFQVTASAVTRNFDVVQNEMPKRHVYPQDLVCVICASWIAPDLAYKQFPAPLIKEITG